MHTELWIPCDDPWIDSTQQGWGSYSIQYVDTATLCLGCLNWCLVVSIVLNVYFDIYQAFCCRKCFEVSSAACLAASCLGKITAWKTKIGDTALLLTGVSCHLNDIPLFSLFSTTCHFEGTTRKNFLFSFTKKPWNMHRVSHNKPHLHPTINYYLLILWEHTTVFIIDCRRTATKPRWFEWVFITL